MQWNFSSALPHPILLNKPLSVGEGLCWNNRSKDEQTDLFRDPSTKEVIIVPKLKYLPKLKKRWLKNSSLNSWVFHSGEESYNKEGALKQWWCRKWTVVEGVMLKHRHIGIHETLQVTVLYITVLKIEGGINKNTNLKRKKIVCIWL